METMEVITDLIRNLGFPIAAAAYFAWRDVKYMSKLDSTLEIIKDYIEKETR